MSSLTKKSLKKKATIKATKKPLKKKATIKVNKKATIKVNKKATIKATKKAKNTVTKPLKKYLNKLKNIKKIGGDIEISRLGKLSNLINEVGSSIS